MLDTRDINNFKNVCELYNTVVMEVNKIVLPGKPHNLGEFTGVANGVVSILTAALNYYNAVENGDGEPDQEWYALKDAIEKFEG